MGIERKNMEIREEMKIKNIYQEGKERSDRRRRKRIKWKEYGRRTEVIEEKSR